jgi:hypothetical protein
MNRWVGKRADGNERTVLARVVLSLGSDWSFVNEHGGLSQPNRRYSIRAASRKCFR